MVQEEEIDAIRRVMESGVAAQPWPYLKVGEIVRIETGPLEGLTGIVTRIRNAYRLVVSVSLLMRSVAVELDSRWIKPLPPMAGKQQDLIRERTIAAHPQAFRMNRS
jgi:transcription antitermination factor NusG